MMKELQEVADVIAACERHDHYPIRLDIQLEKWRAIVSEMMPEDMCVNDCQHEVHKMWRERYAARVGAEPGELFGITVQIAPAPPPAVVAVEALP